MTIWNLIRDWFVQYIWGGATSLGELYNTQFTIGRSYIFINGELDDSFYTTTGETLVNIGFGNMNYADNNGLSNYITMGDWLSTTSTIIVLVLLLIAFGYLIVNLFKMFSNIFSLKR